MSCTESKRIDASALDKPKRANVVCKIAAQMVVRHDIGDVVARGGAGRFQGERIDQVERGSIFLARLDDEDLLILIAEVETVF